MKIGIPRIGRTTRRRRLARVALVLAGVGVGGWAVLQLLHAALRAIAPHVPMIAVLTAIAMIVLGGTSTGRRS